ncbi:MAG TPA: pitrilysin family protein [Thermoanaerobaculia bacterium]|jgi:zinc protease|nr:pitrilysin family protein [Thermoanaerobaculia bacterium]
MAALPPIPPGIDRSAPPRAGDLKPFRFPHFLRTRLPNGLAVLAARHSELPLVSLEMLMPAGGQYDPEGQSGLASLTAAVLDEGTRQRSSMDIATAAERLGGYFATGADWDVGFLATGLLAQNRADALELLAEVAFHPTFPTAEVERLQRQRLAEILRRTQDPSALADDRYDRTLYQGTVYAHPLIGEEASLTMLDREALVGFYQRHYGLDGAVLIAVGDFDPEELLREAERAFATGGPVTPPAPPPEINPPARQGISVHIVDRAGAAQTELRMGHPGVSRSHPDYPSLVVFNGLLGGKFTSRINLNLRERHGYTYGASSRFSGRMGPGPFTVNAAVATESTGAAAREVLFELRRIREALVEPEELTETQSYLVGVFPYTMQTIGDLAKRLETLAVFGLPDDYYTRHLERIASVTREDILDVARRHVDPERVAIVAVGPADALEPQLQGLGPVTVWSPQGEPQLV